MEGWRRENFSFSLSFAQLLKIAAISCKRNKVKLLFFFHLVMHGLCGRLSLAKAFNKLVFTILIHFQMFV